MPHLGIVNATFRYRLSTGVDKIKKPQFGKLCGFCTFGHQGREINNR